MGEEIKKMLQAVFGIAFLPAVLGELAVVLVAIKLANPHLLWCMLLPLVLYLFVVGQKARKSCE